MKRKDTFPETRYSVLISGFAITLGAVAQGVVLHSLISLALLIVAYYAARFIRRFNVNVVYLGTAAIYFAQLLWAIQMTKGYTDVSSMPFGIVLVMSGAFVAAIMGGILIFVMAMVALLKVILFLYTRFGLFKEDEDDQEKPKLGHPIFLDENGDEYYLEYPVEKQKHR